MMSMNGKIKYLFALLLVVIVSVATSYATTMVYLSRLPVQQASVGQVDLNNLPTQMVQQISDDIVLELTRTNLSLPFEFTSYGGNESYVKVHNNISLENLTITFEYTSATDGMTHIESYDYGTYIPSWGAGVIITYGEDPNSYYRVPYTVIQQCATTTLNVDNQTIQNVPQLEVLGVFGYV
jgi:hypothetical protein